MRVCSIRRWSARYLWFLHIICCWWYSMPSTKSSMCKFRFKLPPMPFRCYSNNMLIVIFLIWILYIKWMTRCIRSRIFINRITCLWTNIKRTVICRNGKIHSFIFITMSIHIIIRSIQYKYINKNNRIKNFIYNGKKIYLHNLPIKNVHMIFCLNIGFIRKVYFIRIEIK